MIEETTTKTPIVLTESAVEQLKMVKESQGIPADYGLRVGVKGGGCSGFSYEWALTLKNPAMKCLPYTALRCI
jgi:iron-sulfur cluster assembly protein